MGLLLRFISGLVCKFELLLFVFVFSFDFGVGFGVGFGIGSNRVRVVFLIRISFESVEIVSRMSSSSLAIFGDEEVLLRFELGLFSSASGCVAGGGGGTNLGSFTKSGLTLLGIFGGSAIFSRCLYENIPVFVFKNFDPSFDMNGVENGLSSLTGA
jgi:hypothetical protein